MGAPPTFSASARTPSLRAALRRLDALVDWERRDRVAGSVRRMRVSTQPARALLSRLRDPHAALSAVHVTGSKGKGSVAALVAAALARAALTRAPVGTYSSPHVEAINERVRVDGAPLPDAALAVALSAALDARERAPPVHDATWFDVLWAAALTAFRAARVEWAVVEVGMGGRLDSTNVLSAPVAVVTNVHLEHADIIGPTRLHIAREKAGIIAPRARVVLGMPASDPLAHVFVDEAARQRPPATVTFVPPPEGSLFEHNLAIARAAIRHVAELCGHRTPPEQLLPDHVARAAMAALPARQEPFAIRGVSCLLDGAHVPESVRHVLSEARAARPPVVVLGVGKEKDVAGICRAVLDEQPVHVYATVAGPESPYLPAEDLAKQISDLGGTHVTTVHDACDALHRALETAHEQHTHLVVIGSLHLAGKLRPEMRRLEQQGKEASGSAASAR